ncbi:hypothetical protein, partial [Clostridium tarantellae]|uniref:hypothetical protein n=1 Tax=Clostridium tarantellae TaxID=39493 RepID=UPI001478E888
FKNNKIKALKKEIKLLKDEKTNEINKTTIYSSEEKDEYNEHFFNTQNINLEDTIIKDTKERYINSAKVLNKTYDETLVGNEIYKFECMNLEAITEGQVEGAVLKLTRENFNIKIEECTIGNTVFYKIKLYE